MRVKYWWDDLSYHAQKRIKEGFGWVAAILAVLIIVGFILWMVELDDKEQAKDTQEDWDELVTFCSEELDAEAKALDGDWLCVKDKEIVYDY